MKFEDDSAKMTLVLKMTILSILTSMISILTNLFILEMRNSEEMRKFYPAVIIKCDERREKERGRKKGRTRRIDADERKRVKKEENMVMMFNGGKVIMTNVFFVRGTVNS